MQAAIARRCVPALLALPLFTAAVAARSPSVEPQPRVAYAMHSARINQIRPTPDFRQLVSVSQDKTIRVWRMSDLRLLRTIHVPSEAGEEGSLRSLAITPDGREVIVGGWTGLAFAGESQLYRIDLATGRLLQTLRGFSGVVQALAISRDGSQLAVGLDKGLRVIGLPGGRPLFADDQYNETVRFADFAADGTLATTSHDGCLRLYAPDGKLVFRAEYPQRPASGVACLGAPMGGVRFSPDGARLAFGLNDRVQLVVMTVRQRAIERVVTVDDPKQRSLCCPNFTPDGKHLYLHGAHEGDGATPLYRIDLARTDPPERLDVGRQRFTNILPLAGGDIVFSTNAPSLARVSRQGVVLAEALPPNGDFRFEWSGFRISADASRVALPMRADGTDPRHFSLAAELEAAFRVARSEDMRALSSPRRDGTLRLEALLDEFGHQKPIRINERDLRLQKFQAARSWSAMAQRPWIAVGTQWSVLMADGEGRILWERNLPAPAYQVNASADGRWVVAAVGDGSLRWYSAESGTETLGVFLHNNGTDWVAWRSDGYYASSPGGDEYIGWLINRGDETSPDFLRAVQFERQLYRPDLVRLALAAPDASQPVRTSMAALINSLAPPRVTIEEIDVQRREVRFVVEATGRPVKEVGVYIEGIPVLPASERRVAPAAAGGRMTRTVKLPDNVPLDSLRVEAETDSSLGADDAAAVERVAGAAGSRGRLWVLSIGVERYDDLSGCGTARQCEVSVRELPNAPNDARRIIETLRQGSGRAPADMRTAMLADGTPARPSKQALLAQLRLLEQARAEDTVVLFLASHGIVGGPGGNEYYFLPSDAKAADIISALDGGSQVSSLLSSTELVDAMRRVAGRRVVVIDSCYSGAADGRSSNPYALVKRSAAAQFAVLSAARGDEESIEYFDPRTKHGAFTLALLDGLEGAADADKDGTVTLEEAFAFVGPRVAVNTERVNKQARKADPRHRDLTQTPVLFAQPALRSTALARVQPAVR